MESERESEFVEGEKVGQPGRVQVRVLVSLCVREFCIPFVVLPACARCTA